GQARRARTRQRPCPSWREGLPKAHRRRAAESRRRRQGERRCPRRHQPPLRRSQTGGHRACHTCEL
ncbi:hypothetical protein LTR94_038689, partial [Friedmanniomyces endolithicus]